MLSGTNSFLLHACVIISSTPKLAVITTRYNTMSFKLHRVCKSYCGYSEANFTVITVTIVRHVRLRLPPCDVIRYSYASHTAGIVTIMPIVCV